MEESLYFRNQLKEIGNRLKIKVGFRKNGQSWTKVEIDI